jgi:tetratricopeptide (TPR) repeat protein
MRKSLLVCILVLAAACGRSPRPPAVEARHYAGVDTYRRAISTADPEAQRWFDQGLTFLYGFNHDEAIRSFTAAARRDPSCAMAWWGVAYANGLHINNTTMTAAQSEAAWDAAQQALAHVDAASPVEQALVRAVARRYARPVPEDRRPLDEAYAAAMEDAARTFPDDPDVGALYVEALMNLQPWDLWNADGTPKGRTPDIVATLERVMAAHPNHPGANHFYIHAVEASGHPERATAAADRLRTLVPGSGHLVHMPSHVYIRTGRYADAAASNEQAIAADRRYFAEAPPPGFYNLYYLHDLHFLAYASMMEGRFAAALDAARRIEREVPESFVREFAPQADGLTPVALHALVRFGRWEDVLAEPAPAEFRLASIALRHWARSVALAALGRPDEARDELRALDAAAARVPNDWYVGVNPAASVLQLARTMALGEILYREGRARDAFATLRDAVRQEEALAYDEPPGWMHPVRHALGALLLRAGRVAEAERVYRDDLARHPHNGWALTGLEQALRAQGKGGDAREVAAQVAAAWARSDVKPGASCYCASDS